MYVFLVLTFLTPLSAGRLSAPKRLRTGGWVAVDLLVIAFSLYAAALLAAPRVLNPMHVALAREPSALLTVSAFMGALAASGAYRNALPDMHLRRFLWVGMAMLSAALASTALTYFWNPAYLLPRGMTALHALMATSGVLGSRALGRLVLEQLALEERQPATPPRVAPPSITLHDVVDRDAPVIRTQELRDALADRTVLVTGAGGSIGSELMAQLARIGPFRLVGVDMSEYNLYRLRHMLQDSNIPLPESDLDLRLADIRDAEAMHRIFRETAPNVVVHTAAYKHVPLMEHHPAEAFRNNTRATIQLLQLCEEHQTGQFLFVSTDKAVRPTSVLGATKQLAEWYVRTAQSPVARSIVRFGNVFGSRGSVVPRFERHLAAGKPIPVTHPDMERYFMSSTEACSLIMHTLLLDSHPVYLFRMGEPVCIQDLAEQLVRRWYPHRRVASMIEHVGRRPGEKMTEALAMPGEETSDTAHPSIVGVRGAMPYSRAELDVHIRHVEAQCRAAGTSASQLRRLIMNTPGSRISTATRS